MRSRLKTKLLLFCVRRMSLYEHYNGEKEDKNNNVENVYEDILFYPERTVIWVVCKQQSSSDWLLTDRTL